MARKTKTLSELHAEANGLAASALNVFHSVADDLNRAALSHQEVADRAQAEVDAHAALRDAATAAANDAARQAETVRSLVS